MNREGLWVMQGKVTLSFGSSVVDAAAVLRALVSLGRCPADQNGKILTITATMTQKVGDAGNHNFKYYRIYTPFSSSGRDF